MPASSAAVRFGSVLIALGILAAGPARAQQLGSKESLLSAFNRDAQNRHRDLYRGDGEKADKKADAKVAEAAAQYYLYRATHRMDKSEYDAMHKDFSYFVGVSMEMTSAKKPRQNREYIEMIGPKLVEAMTQVLDRDANRDPITVVQAAIMLPMMAKLKQENIADYLVGLVSKKETHPIVALYAIKALREYMPINSYPENDNFFSKMVLARKRNDIRFVEPLAAFIERNVKVDHLPGDEAATVNYIRREAIISLGQAGVPAVVAFPKPQKIDNKLVQVEGLVAPALLKVLAKDALNPPPSLQEKIEAVVGLAGMKYNNVPDYNPDLATYLMGRTLVDFMAEYNRDLNNFVGAKKKIPYIAWRAESRRLDAALGQWAKTNGDKGNADRLYKPAKEVLKSIYTGGNFVPINDLSQSTFRNVIPTLLPKTGGAVFKNAPAPTIPLN